MLITAAVAVTGCTTVVQQPAPGPSSAPVWPALPLPQNRTDVRQPDQQSLASVPVEPASVPQTSATAATAATVSPEAVRRRHRARTPAPARRHPVPAAEPARRPRPAAALPGGAGVCALGRTYGGWADNSDAARICRQSYGR